MCISQFSPTLQSMCLKDKRIPTVKWSSVLLNKITEGLTSPPVVSSRVKNISVERKIVLGAVTDYNQTGANE